MEECVGVAFETGDTVFQECVQSDNYVRTTRYTALSFLPMTLLENFQRFANVYFLFMAIIGFFPWSPISPVVQVFPLVFVIAVSMVKSGIEDFMRYRNDLNANSVLYEVFNQQRTKFLRKKSSGIKPGDIIRIKDGQEIPADVVVIGVSSVDATSYINEVNLNGETALKQKRCLFDVERNLTDFHAKISIAKPNQDILKLDGLLEIGSQSVAFNIKNCYLRGTVLMHTKYAICIALYTGHDTRIIQNQRHPPNKISHLEKRLNQLVLGDFIVNIAIVFLLTGFSLVQEKKITFSWIVKESNLGTLFWQNFTAYAILMSYMIPISLYVTIEVVRFFQRWTFQLDLSMYEPGLGYATVHNSNLNEELGMIDHVFSDKTGTLTENKMSLVKASIGSEKFDLRDPNDYLKAEAREGLLTDLFIDVGLCNSVIITEDGLSSESPDEEALIKKSNELGVQLLSKGIDTTLLKVGEVETQYEVLATIEFTSARKRMSVIVRNPKGELILYSKGADSVMLSLLNDSQDSRETQESVDSFARLGLRTLVLCKKQISEDEFHIWKEEYDKSFLTMQNRDENVARAGALIEKDFEIIGSVAIEDELQPDVGETINFLSKMQINLWVLTGDKKETAVSIGKSTNVISSTSEIIYFEEPSSVEEIKSAIANAINPVLVISPTTLESVFDTPFLADVSNFCHHVICYRMSPNNKAKVVETIREFTNKICLAVGDGANDVSMIQAAHVGVGIFGREGHQAASNSDFAITRFRHLRRLLAVHGRLSLVRISGVILYMISKNILLIFPQMWYCIYTACSPTTAYNDLLLSSFNIIWSSLPPVIYGCFEQDVSPQSMMQRPQLYVEARAGRYSSWWRIGLEVISVFYQSVIIFFFSIFFPATIITDESMVGSQYGSAGLSMFVAVVFAADIQAAVRSHHWNVYTFLGIYLSLFLFLLFTITYGSFPFGAADIFMVPQQVYTNFMPYCYFIITIVLCIAPEALFRFLKGLWFPSYTRIIREQELIAEKEIKNERMAKRLEVFLQKK